MPPRIPSLCSSRLATPHVLSSRPLVPLRIRLAPRRTITAGEKPLPKSDEQGPGPNQEQLPHVSEEASATGKITGEGGPELEQGTPVEDASFPIHETSCTSRTDSVPCSPGSQTRYPRKGERAQRSPK